MRTLGRAGCFEDDILSPRGVSVFLVGLDQTVSWQ